MEEHPTGQKHFFLKRSESSSQWSKELEKKWP